MQSRAWDAVLRAEKEQPMLARNLAELSGTDRDVGWGNGQSRRFLVQRDGMGFALCDSTALAGTKSPTQYRNRLMACYCIEGRGEVDNMEGQVIPVESSVLYAVNHRDKYRLRAHGDLRVFCVFDRPISGNERHRLDARDGPSYRSSASVIFMRGHLGPFPSASPRVSGSAPFCLN